MTYKCKKCGKEFATIQGLGGHSNVVHSNPHLQAIRLKTYWDSISENTKQKSMENARRLKVSYLNDIKLTQFQRQLILGSLMGDMAINYPNSHSNAPRCVIRHSLKQSQYVDWKYSAMKDLCGSPPKPEVNNGYGTMNYVFTTRSLPCLKEVYNIVKVDGKIQFTEEWLSQITDPIAITMWYLDDGHKTQNNDFSISLGKITPEEGDILKGWLMDHWDIYSTVCHGKKESRLGIYQTKYVKKFTQILLDSSFIPPTMQYKIPCMI